jgi:hypothetical protein
MKQDRSETDAGHVAHAQEAWRQLCRQLESTGARALAETLVAAEIDVAEGLRYLTRIACLCLEIKVENTDAVHPYFGRNIGPTRKMGGDNPVGHYASAPIDGYDTYRITGIKGTAGWVSFQLMRSPSAVAQGMSVMGGALLLPELVTTNDGRFEIVVSPDHHDGNWIQSDPHVELLLVRQFFDADSAVMPMDLAIENLTRGGLRKQVLALDDIVRKVASARDYFALIVPWMQGMVRLNRDHSVNCFETADGGVQSAGGVPGGSPITGYWRLASDEALVMTVAPPADCYYWDVQVGNCWYESWDYRHFISGLGGSQVEQNPDGSVTLVLSEQDPGTTNWLECAGHTEGHMAIRWQAIAGPPPKPDCRIISMARLPEVTGHLHRVTAEQRRRERQRRHLAVEQRFRL